MTFDKNYILKWYAKADNDLLAAEKLIQDDSLEFLGLICFLCQQCVEKYLKSFLAFHKVDFPYTHDLESLLDQCIELDKEFSHFDFKDLSDYAVEFRYPESAFTPSGEEVKEKLEIARSVKSFVRNKLNLEK